MQHNGITLVFLFVCLNCMCMDSSCTYDCASHVCGTCGSQKREPDSLKLELKRVVCELPCGRWDSNLEELPVLFLIAEPSFQPDFR